MFEVIDLNETQTEIIDEKLNAYDDEHIKYKLTGSVSIGVTQNGALIAGANGCMTAYKIFYVSTVYVDESYRMHGIGRKLMDVLEQKAISLGASIIRLDTFDYQGVKFYQKLGYEMVGSYECGEEGFAEYFFLKRLRTK
jgi:GNAT superfamily N-acetyltransferase